MHFPENTTFVELLEPAADAAGRSSAIYASLKNVQRAWIICHITQGAANTILLTPKQATDVAGGAAKALDENVPIWTAEDLATSDVLTRETSDAKNFTTSAAIKHKLVAFQIDPALLDAAGGFDCIGLTTGASAAANITSAVLLAELRYGSDVVPSLIAD